MTSFTRRDFLATAGKGLLLAGFPTIVPASVFVFRAEQSHQRRRDRHAASKRARYASSATAAK